ncbi:hypothetical protein N7537_008411 [Penicillium hordei]|jgi:hypothetical protein|uniref:Uncharacterized protein n=1 Tax=Penicillium hordei TaxID=40994 RepID=A0AAD6E0F7_9EURO|nr:uncharacterized protein N7537_008411 [Penicillium hordei]KAJ5598327.1 hypothetical protein N7537_008411 [Penicillium hordei]
MIRSRISVPYTDGVLGMQNREGRSPSEVAGPTCQAPQEKFQGRRLKLIGRIGNWKVYVGETPQKLNNVRGPDV